MMESININKYLIKEKNQYYTIDNIEIILSLSQILDEDNLIIMDSMTLIY